MPSEKQIQAAIKAAINAVWTGSGEDNAQYCMMKAALTAAEQTEPAPAARSGAVKVRKLEWKEGRNCECSAETVIGTYEVGFDDGWWAQLECGVTWDWNPPYDPRSYEGPFAAKAAAQADYERRILAAIEPAEPAADAEPVAWLMNGRGENWEERNVVTFDKETADMKAVTEWWTVEPLYKSRPPESQLREALEKIAKLKTDLGVVASDYNRGFMHGRWNAVNIATAALAQGGDDELA